MFPSIASIATRARAVPMAPLALAFSLLACTSLAAPVHAAIHVCPTAGGATVFQDRPCERTRPAAGTRPSERTRSPLGLDDSWFARPPGTDVIVRCDTEGCRCDGVRRPFDSGLALAVADALYLDGAWHRHDGAVAARAQARMDGPSPDELQASVDEAACDVMISQRVLRSHGEDVLADLRRRAREAEERGYDDGRGCREGDPRACEYHDSLTLYRRMVADLAALRSPRGGAGATTAPAISEGGRGSR